MASALVNNVALAIAPDPFSDFITSTSCGWLSPRISFSLDFPNENDVKTQISTHSPSLLDFEFRPDDPVSMLPADELISGGKLVPLQLAVARSQTDSVDLESETETETKAETQTETEIASSMDPEKSSSSLEDASVDACVLSPKAPRCSSRWKEILGLKKAWVQSQIRETKAKSSTPSRGLKHFLHRNPKSCITTTVDSLSTSLSLPLLCDTVPDPDPTSLSSLSSSSLSSSSALDHEDSEKATQIRNVRVSKSRNNRPLPDHPHVRVGRSQMRRAPEAGAPPRGASVDSPRMNSSGKVVFQNLGRSSSSPSSFNGGPRVKHRGMERSHSGTVRITPVLNVPVCSLRGSSKSVFGLGPLFSQQKKEVAAVRNVCNVRNSRREG